MKFKKRGLCTAGEEVSQLRDKMYALNRKIQNIQHGVDKQLQHFKKGSGEPPKERLAPKTDVRKNLVFSGVDLDDVRMELIKISTYCQDILEARVRSVLYDQLNITRDIPMDEVYIIETDKVDPRSKTIVVSFVNQADKWEILCLARVTKMTNVTITEDLTNSRLR